jgi:hypothetical protein
MSHREQRFHHPRPGPLEVVFTSPRHRPVGSRADGDRAGRSLSGGGQRGAGRIGLGPADAALPRAPAAASGDPLFRGRLSSARNGGLSQRSAGNHVGSRSGIGREHHEHFVRVSATAPGSAWRQWIGARAGSSDGGLRRSAKQSGSVSRGSGADGPHRTGRGSGAGRLRQPRRHARLGPDGCQHSPRRGGRRGPRGGQPRSRGASVVDCHRRRRRRRCHRRSDPTRAPRRARAVEAGGCAVRRRPENRLRIESAVSSRDVPSGGVGVRPRLRGAQ